MPFVTRSTRPSAGSEPTRTVPLLFGLSPTGRHANGPKSASAISRMRSTSPGVLALRSESANVC